MKKMNAAIKKRWVKALRSGKYEQGTNMLRNDPLPGEKYQYCCLGVLYAMDGNKPSSWSNGGLGEKKAKVCGISSAVQDALVDRNDGRGDFELKPWSFPKIATWIEKNL